MSEQIPARQRDDIRAVLEQHKGALRDDIADALDNTGEEALRRLAGEVRDAADSSVAALIGDLNLYLVRARVDELRKVEQTLVRMDRGTWGYCEDCGDPMPPARLAAMPTATRCLTCQERHERDYEGVAPRSL